MLKQKNSKMQGNVGIGAAIAHYTSIGCVVSMPLTDSQDYDLIVDYGASLNKVQVKTTTFKKNNTYVVTMRSCNLQGQTAFDNTKVDEVFVLTEDGTKYAIPSSEVVVKSNLTLGVKYETYKV